MSTFISEPGTRIGGRYRLEDRVSASSGWSVWKAIDETLARPVTVLTFAPGFPRISEVVTAARAASRLTDARLAQVFDVFDVEEDWEHAYVVMEWAAGEGLDDMLADGPLDPGRASEILCQAAEALACAHAAGVAHLCLTPAALHWSAGGGVKIAGLGIDAALAGTVADDPALADTRGLATLLYAALTAHWPGDGWPGLPAAPEVDGHPRSPRQVIAGVPAALDEITCQALLPWSTGNGDVLTTPEAFAAALARVAPPRPAPAAARRTAPPRPTSGTTDWNIPSVGPDRWESSRRSGTGGYRALAGAVAVLVAAALGLGAWMLVHGNSAAPHSDSGSHHHAAPPAAILAPADVAAFGPDGGDNQAQAPLAIDGNPSTDWYTNWYKGSPYFGNLSKGTGLVLDMGKSVSISSVKVTFGPLAGGDANVQVSDSEAGPGPAGFTSGTTIGSATGASGTFTFRPSSPATGRYVLIWFTKLPPRAGFSGEYQGDVYNVVVRGSG